MAAPMIFFIIYILGSFRVIVSINLHFLKLGDKYNIQSKSRKIRRFSVLCNKTKFNRKFFVKLFFGFLILLSYGTISFCESKYIEKRKVIWKIEKNFHLELDFF